MRTFEEIKQELPNYISLIYIDYNDNLSERSQEIQECIQNHNFDSIYNLIDSWDIEFWEINRIIKKLELSEEEERKYKDLIIEEIYERDKSNPVKDLFNNTGKMIMFYETNLKLEEPDSKEDIIEQVYQIKKKLKIKNNFYDKEIKEMVEMASYGGNLVIYFRDYPYYYINNSINKLEFTDPVIAIVNNYNGSGGHAKLEGHKIEIDFYRNRLFIELAVKYNYTYDVCGMYDYWCDLTKVKIQEGEENLDGESQTALLMEKEKEYNLTFKNGGCTFGDMDIKRHRDVEYINSYPCGNKCPHCGTFWID